MAAPRIGVFGGTFDPIHIGHLAAAVEVRHALALDRVLLVVSNTPWQKVGSRSITPAEDRYAVVEAAAAGLEGIEPSRIEIDRGGESYTADTLAELTRGHPGAELFLVVGADIAAALDTWARGAEIRDLAHLAVVTRPGSEDSAIPPGWDGVTVTVPSIAVSSTDLRARVADGRPIDVLVPPAAVRCIRERGLYAG